MAKCFTVSARLWAPAIKQGEGYRLVTAMFLHGGLIHIGFNMMVLLDIGPVVEEVYGSARYLFLYTFTGIVGFILSAFTPFRPHPVLAIGASGAILGLIGIMIALTTRRGGASMQALAFPIGVLGGFYFRFWISDVGYRQLGARRRINFRFPVG